MPVDLTRHSIEVAARYVCACLPLWLNRLGIVILALPPHLMMSCSSGERNGPATNCSKYRSYKTCTKRASFDLPYRNTMHVQYMCNGQMHMVLLTHMSHQSHMQIAHNNHGMPQTAQHATTFSDETMQCMLVSPEEAVYVAEGTWVSARTSAMTLS